MFVAALCLVVIDGDSTRVQGGEKCEVHKTHCGDTSFHYSEYIYSEIDNRDADFWCCPTQNYDRLYSCL